MKALWKFILVYCVCGIVIAAYSTRNGDVPLRTNLYGNIWSLNGTLANAAGSMKVPIKDGIEILNQLLPQVERINGDSCLLDSIKNALMWWAYPNGTLKLVNSMRLPTLTYADLSYGQICSDDDLYLKIETLQSYEITIFSAAYNNLTSVPRRSLILISDSLKYLTLSGNKFSASGPYWRNDGIAWATFPYMPNLIELDVSNCQIEFITKDVFHNVSNLKSLYISRNKISTIPFDAFYHLESLQFLDLSHTHMFDYNYQVSQPSLEALVNKMYGLKIQQMTFKYLPNLVYLDLSYTKMTRNSAMAFTHLGTNLKYLSLCYTAFPMVNNAILKNTALIGMDLSGNTYAAYNMAGDAFEGVSNSLSVLYFEHANLKDISWLQCLTNLKVLSLAGNNINSLTLDTFSPISNLQVLDLSSNHIGNWYTRVFSNNLNLRVLSLRENNINIITSEMLKDFADLDYLSIGDNNFVCDCMLRDLMDLVTSNTQKSDCARSLMNNAQKLASVEYTTIHNVYNDVKHRMELLTEFELQIPMDKLNITSIVLAQSIFRNRNKQKTPGPIAALKNISKIKFSFGSMSSKMGRRICQSTKSQTTAVNNTFNGFLPKFQLLDYHEDHYWCFNETEKTSFLQLSCHQRSFVHDVSEQIHNLTIYVISSACTLLTVCIIGLVIYFKRWHIYYYYSSLKTAALFSAAAKKNVDQLEPNMSYDIFISYCHSDREWVLNELMPNMEESGDIAICLHERDFQVGVTILDNIISCMDRSRGLMLIISANFLLSHWCQFEMHLAQHRSFDASSGHLILVFLEDIPIHKRPRHLHILMESNTFIKWPGSKKNYDTRWNDHKLFWKRLKRAVQCMRN